MPAISRAEGGQLQARVRRRAALADDREMIYSIDVLALQVLVALSYIRSSRTFRAPLAFAQRTIASRSFKSHKNQPFVK
jgi:hypothetical protein